MLHYVYVKCKDKMGGAVLKKMCSKSGVKYKGVRVDPERKSNQFAEKISTDLFKCGQSRSGAMVILIRQKLPSRPGTHPAMEPNTSALLPSCGTSPSVATQGTFLSICEEPLS